MQSSPASKLAGLGVLSVGQARENRVFRFWVLVLLGASNHLQPVYARFAIFNSLAEAASVDTVTRGSSSELSERMGTTVNASRHGVRHLGLPRTGLLIFGV